MKKKINKNLIIVIVILLLLNIVLGISLINAKKTTTQNKIDGKEASNKAINFINKYALQPGQKAAYEEHTLESGVIKTIVSIAGQNNTLYISNDGKYIFPQGIDITEEPQLPPEQPQAQNLEVSTEGRNFKGAENAEVTIVEYSSFSCGYCNKVRPTINKILETYPNNVKFVFKNFDRGGTDSKAAQAAECAAEQGKFWEMHETLFDKGSHGDLKEYAKDLGLDTKTFDECLDSNKYASLVTSDTAEGQANGVTGTPAFIINGKLVTGAQPFETFKQIIDSELTI